jgi:hypothetical protein
MKKILMILTLSAACTFTGVHGIYATPSTQIWNPSTDIQAENTFHLGIDDYFSITKNDSKAYSFPTDVGLTYGLLKYCEIGIDALEPSADPLYFNLKLGLPEKDGLPALAIGAMSLGTKKNITNYNILYVVTAMTFKPLGRFSLGYYTGNKDLLVDETGDKANTGAIVSWDKQLTDKIWASVDYASGKSYYGEVSFGASYAFSSNTSVIFGYVVYNNDDINRNNQFTTQLDINFG